MRIAVTTPHWKKSEKPRDAGWRTGLFLCLKS
jgi:hypothetical protein